jgi:hypothetical protein
MGSNSSRFLEALEGRKLMSTVAYGDFNHDGREDKVEVTDATTLTVSLKKLDGTYKVSAVLTTPKKYPVGETLNVGDFDSDGDLDIYNLGFTNDGYYVHKWFGNGDGTFGPIKTQVVRPHGYPRGFF